MKRKPQKRHAARALPPLRRLLVFNSHEAWVHQLDALDVELHVIVGLGGRLVSDWDTRMRPPPRRATFVTLEQVLARPAGYDCIVAHNVTDLLAIKDLPGARLVILHTTLEGRILEEQSSVSGAEMGEALKRYTKLVHAHAVSVSPLKAASWGLGEWVPFAADPAEYLPHEGTLASGLRISNQITKRRHILLWDLHEQAFAGLPVTLVGHNHDLPGVRAAESWQELKQILAAHRFYVHTAVPELEDGYNMATLEAMAAGLPVLGNAHPSSPVEHGTSGFLSDDPRELRAYAERLLAEPELAQRLGNNARERVRERFSPELFRRAFLSAVHVARTKYRARHG